LSVLTFHQGMIFLLHTLAIPGLEVAALPYRFTPVPPLGVPLILDLCFWGGLYGVVFGLVTPAPKGLMPLRGLAFGVLAVLVGFFVVAWIKGNPIGGGWVLANWIRSLLINGLFGVGLGLIYPPLARLVFRAA
jgi:hypothetical protein